MKFRRRIKTPAEVVSQYVRPGDPAECWPWRGAINMQGYGAVRINYQQLKAHRVVYEVAKGAIPEGLVIRHTCDNPPCVNPAHLIPGTPADNARDKVERDRCTRGEMVNTARLTESDIPAIRARGDAGESTWLLAAEYGVSESAVRHILSGRTWRHVA